MEFPFNAQKIFKVDGEGFVVLNGRDLSGYAGVPAGPSLPNRFGEKRDTSKMSQMAQIAMVLDQMGEASSKAQQLPQTITSMGRFAGTNQRLFLKVEGNTVLGLLKTGERTIFYRNYAGVCKELNPLCVLDFYVHESLQRQGIGNNLFYFMLEYENILPNKIAYDRPSPKLLKFLDKHYGLKAYIPQNNNFVIYEDFWNSGYSIPKKTLESLVEDGHYQNKTEEKVTYNDFPPEQPKQEHYFEEEEPRGADLYKEDYRQPHRDDNRAKAPRGTYVREQENHLKEVYTKNILENKKKISAHNASHRGQAPYWEEAPPEPESKLDKFRNTHSGFNQKRPSESSREFNQDHNPPKRQPDGLTLAGVPHYDQRFQKDQTSLPSIQKNKAKPRSPQQYNLVPAMYPEPSVSKAGRGKTSMYDREMSTLE